LARARYLVRRLAAVLVTLWGVSLLLFAMLQLQPGGPAQAALGITATPQQIAALDRELGYDQSLPVRYGHYLVRLAHGDLGESVIFGRPVVEVIAAALPTTLKLGAYVLLLSAVTTVPLATLAALRRGGPVDHAIRALPSVGLGMPSFWVAVVLLFLFALRLPVFPAGGLQPGLAGGLRSLFLPAVTLSVAVSAVLVRSLRRGLIDTLESEHVTAARARGLTGARLLLGHVLPNAAIPTLTLTSLVFASLLGGTVVVESVFALPGVGQLLVDGFRRHDVPLVMGIALLTAALVMTVNLLVDVVYAVLDPRVGLR
jgi:peptide/nickel transport system permease protein